MRIWIFNHYAGDMYASEGGRHYSIAKYLKRNGNEPVVFCANTKHNTKSEIHFQFKGLWHVEEATPIKVPFVFIKARGYNKNGKKRILNMVDYYRNLKKATKRYSEIYGNPEIIIASSVHPLTLLAGISIAKRYNVKCICEIRDLWPESIVVYTSRFKRNSFLIRMLYHGEHYIYKKADALIFTMQGGYEYIKSKEWDKDIQKSKVYCLNNGVDLEDFFSNLDNYHIGDKDLDNTSIFKIVYTGSIRKVNNIERLLDIAKTITKENIRIIVYGDGDMLPDLKEKIENEGITNVVFKGRIEKKYIPYVLCCADVNLLHNNDSELFKYGISLNKLFEYFAAGKPIVSDFVSNYNPAEQMCAGPIIKTSSVKEIAYELERVSDMTCEEYEYYCNNAKDAAEKYSYEKLTRDLQNIINQIM